MPNSELDQLMKIPESLLSSRVVEAFSYSVEDGNLVMTVLSRDKQTLFLPDQSIIDKNEKMFDDDVFCTESDVENLLADEDISPSLQEEYFSEYGATRYALQKSKVSLNDLSERAVKYMSSHPMTSLKPSLSSLISSASIICNVGGYVFNESEEQILSEAEVNGLNDKSVVLLNEYFKNNSDFIDSLKDFLRAQNPSGVLFFSAKPRGFSSYQYFNAQGEPCQSPFSQVFRMPGMESVTKTIETGVQWGVRYDAANSVLQCTLNGKEYSDRLSSCRINPEDLSLILSGYAGYPSHEPFIFLFSEKGLPYLEEIRKTLPDPKPIFEQRVDTELKDITAGNKLVLDLLTDGDKPYGLYFRAPDGKAISFIPYEEFLHNKNVLHLCSLTGTDMLDGSFRYESKEELVKDGDRYFVRYGHPGDVEKEEDNIKYYPDIFSEITIKDNKIVKTMLFEGKCHGPSSAGGYYGTSAPSPDVPNSRYRSANPIESAVQAAAIFRWRDFVKQNFRIS